MQIDGCGASRLFLDPFLFALCIWMCVLLPDMVRWGLRSFIVLWSPGLLWPPCCPATAFLVVLSCLYFGVLLVVFLYFCFYIFFNAFSFGGNSFAGPVFGPWCFLVAVFILLLVFIVLGILRGAGSAGHGGRQPSRHFALVGRSNL